jgi:hypothetical protein
LYFYNFFLKILENTSFSAPSKNTRISYVTTMQALLYYNRVSTVTKNRSLGKAWEAQLTMLVAGKKCWVGSVKKWLLQNQPQEVAGFLPPAQSSLETTF